MITNYLPPFCFQGLSGNKRVMGGVSSLFLPKSASKLPSPVAKNAVHVAVISKMFISSDLSYFSII